MSISWARGYEDLVGKLTALGADITRAKPPPKNLLKREKAPSSSCCPLAAAMDNNNLSTLT
jgi:hypothetical protein